MSSWIRYSIISGVVSLAVSVTSACATSDSEVGFPAGGHNADSGMDEAGSSAGSEAGGAGGVGGEEEQAGSIAVAGAGGAAGGGASGTSGAGAGGAGAGGAVAVAGTGGSAAGAGGAAAGAGGTGQGGGDDTCDSRYTMASHISLNVSWDGSLAIKSGSGVVHIWTKTIFNDDGTTAQTESMSCGSALPVINTSAFAGNKKVLPEIPDAAWDNAKMPKFKGTMTRSGNKVMIDPGVALVGLSMKDPLAAWPGRTEITGVDHDGDGKLGLTAIPKDGDGYSPPPTSIEQKNFVDKLYLVTRNVMTMQSTQEGCPQMTSGTATVTKFDNHIIGCHVKGGAECSAADAKFVDDNRTVYKVGTATFVAKVVPESATCADVRAALPAK